jgi:hypothetical protein
MAFNPFHRFRKHQKVFMAFLAVMCMIIFVFQFGAGDVFTRGLGWFGAMRGRGEVITTLYGDKIREGDLDKVRRQRRLANEFMMSPGRMSLPVLLVAGMQELQQKAMKTGPESLPPVPPAAMDIVRQFLFRNNPQFSDRIPFETRQREIQDNLRSLRDQFQLPGIIKNADQLRALETIAMAVAFEDWTMSPERGEYYFGGRDKTEDHLDFLIWKHQADKLGIELSEADVIREINRAVGNFSLMDPEESFDRNNAIVGFISPGDRGRRATPGATASDLLTALRDEFRVQLAKEALLGHGSGVRAHRNETEPVRLSPAAATPDEFLAYFRDQRTTLRVSVLPFSVAEFSKQVTDEPSFQELQNRYEQYKNDVAEPDSARPGFKQPRRMTLQYVSANPESAFYQAEARKMARALGIYSDAATSAAMRIAAGFNGRAAGGGLAAWAGLVAIPSSFDPLLEEYENYRQREQFNIGQHIGTPFDLRERTLPSQRPAFAAAQLGQFLIAGGGIVGPLGALGTLPAADALFRQANIDAFSSAVLAGASSTPLTTALLPTFFLHTPLSREEARPILLERYEKKRADEIARNNLQTLMAELRKLKDKPAEAQKYVAKAVKEFGLENFHTTSGLQSRYQLVDDPEFKPLKEAWEAFTKDFRNNPFQPAELPPLIDYLFAQNASISVYQAEQFPPELFSSGKVVWAFWKTEDSPARVRPFDEVRDEVLASWRLDRARPLARARAEKAVEAIKAQHPEEERQILSLLRELRADPKEEPFELKGVAHLIAPEFVPFRRERPEFRPYQLPADKIAYPPSNFVDRLLTLQKPGDALIVADRPMKHYYVVVLLTRDEPQRREFYDLYEVPAMEDPIWKQMMMDRRRQYQLELVKQLRAEAGKVDSEGNLVISAAGRDRGEGTPATDE